MKKYNNAFMPILAVCLSICIVSCSENGYDDREQKDPVEDVKMGTYSVYCPSLTISYWPDSETGITELFQSYCDNILSALNVDQKKDYRWSDIEADKDRLQKTFDTTGDFEYSVKSCRNYTSVNGDIMFGAYMNGSDYPDIDFGRKRLICKLDVPADITCQLHIEMTSYETIVPSAKEYNTNVRSLFAEALKEVFTGQYGVQENITNVAYLNYANCSGDSNEFSELIKKACEAVVIPELPTAVKNDAQSVTSPGGARLSDIFVIYVFLYDPHSYRILASEKEIFSHRISIR